MMASLALPGSLDPYSNRYFSGEFDEFSRLSQDFTRKVRFNYYVTIDEEEEEKPEHEPEEEGEENEPIVDESEEEEEFSFPLPILEESPISAEEAFQDGQIRPVLYPIFDQSLLASQPPRSPISADESFQIRPLFSIFDYTAAEGGDSNNSAPSPRPPLKKLFVEQRDSISSPETDGSAAGPYCEWSPESCRKSNSTGFSKIWKLRDMVVHRSNSDGNDAFVFLNNNKNKRSGSEKVVVKKEVKNKTTPSAHELHYVTNRAMREEVKRRSYLPYRQGVVGVGFFTSVNGLTRNLHPY